MPFETTPMTLHSSEMNEILNRKDLRHNLHDSLEFYKLNGLTSVSPPKNKDSTDTLLVPTDEEEDDGYIWENNLPAKPLMGRFFSSGNETDSESEGSILLGDEEDDINYPPTNFDDDSDSDMIVFADSDEEEQDDKTVSTPFWFGNEDKEQLKYINEAYYRKLNLPEEKKKLVRQPEPFVGRVTRSKVDNGIIFSTMDTIEVYRRSTVAPGTILPYIRTVYLLTSWSYDDGLPISFECLDNEKSRTAWRGKLIKNLKPSIILCLPNYRTVGYQFFVTNQNIEVTHSPDSINSIERPCWYEKYIPEDLRYPSSGQLEEDENVSNM